MANVKATQAWLDVQAAHERGDMVAAMSRLKSLAATGDRAAPVEIAHIYELGIGGVPQDMTQAISWYEKAAFECGEPKAYLALGRISLGTEEYEKALHYFQQCVDSEMGAQFALGLIYHLGLGVAVDLTTASRYYRQAAGNGHLLALKNLGGLEMRSGRLWSGTWHYLSALPQILVVAVRSLDNPRIRIA